MQDESKKRPLDLARARAERKRCAALTIVENVAYCAESGKLVHPMLLPYCDGTDEIVRCDVREGEGK